MQLKSLTDIKNKFYFKLRYQTLLMSSLMKRLSSSNNNSAVVPDVSNDLAKFAPRAYRAAVKKGFLSKDENESSSSNSGVETAGKSSSPSSLSNFYCLFSNLLYCFQNDDPNSYLGLIFLEGSTVKKIDKGAGTTESPTKHCISITTVGGKNVILMVDSADQRQEWIDCIEQHKVVSIGRHMEDMEAETLQLTHRVGELESDVKHVEGINELLEMNLSHMSAQNEALVAQLKDLESRLGAEMASHRAVDQERKLLLRARGILPRTIPSWALTRAITSPAGTIGLGMNTGGGSGRMSSVSVSDPPPLPVGALDMAKVWVGTWNVGAMEPFVGMDLQRSYQLLRPFVPSGYDIYFIGIQEGVKEGVFELMEGLLASEGCRRIRLDSLNATNGNNGQNTEVKEDNWQEMGGDGGGSSRASVAAGGDMSKIIGRVDGSSGMFSSKYSGIALFVRQQYLPYLKVHTLNQYAVAPQQSSSKGAVGVVCSILGRTVLFLTAELESKDNEKRRRQFADITTSLGSLMGERGYHLNEQFHHIIWCGALNYGLLDISGNPLPADIALKMLKDHLNITLYDTHDQLNQEKRSHHVFFGYREANPFPNFYPTYKKIENRPRLNYSDPDGAWLQKCYRIRYKEPFYKGGKIRETTPSYCDRILYHSLADLATDLLPEPVAVDLTLLPSQGHSTTVINNINTIAERSTTKMIDNYQSVNDGEGMSISDHSPVFGTFLVRLFHDHAANMVVSEDQPPVGQARQQQGDGDFDADADAALATTVAVPTRNSQQRRSKDKGTPSRGSGSLRSKHSGSCSKLIYVEGHLQNNKVSRGNSLCDYGASNASGSAPVSPLKSSTSSGSTVLAADVSNISMMTASDATAVVGGGGIGSKSDRNLMGEFDESDTGRRQGLEKRLSRSGSGSSSNSSITNSNSGGVTMPAAENSTVPPLRIRTFSAFSGGSLLPPGPYTIRISNFRLLWGTMDSAPAAVCVLFPLPYEVRCNPSC